MCYIDLYSVPGYEVVVISASPIRNYTNMTQNQLFECLLVISLTANELSLLKGCCIRLTPELCHLAYIVDYDAAHCEHWCLPAPHWTVGRLDACHRSSTRSPKTRSSPSSGVCVAVRDVWLTARGALRLSPETLNMYDGWERFHSHGCVKDLLTYEDLEPLDPLEPTQWTLKPTWHQTFWFYLI